MTYDAMAVPAINFRIEAGNSPPLFFGTNLIRQSSGFEREGGEFRWRPEKRADLKGAIDSWWSDAVVSLVDFRSSFCESFKGICHPIETLRTIERGWRYNLYLLCIAVFATSFMAFS